MEPREFIPFEEVLDSTFGQPGTPERAEYDLSVEMYMIGHKIKEIREAKKLTQEDLGKLIGVQKAQISKIESGKNLTIATVMKVFRALDFEISLQINDKGLIAAALS